MSYAVVGLSVLLPAVGRGAVQAPTPPPPPSPPRGPPMEAPALMPPPPPNVLFLVDNNESMLDFAQYLPEDFTPGFSPPANSQPGTRGYTGKEGSFVNTGCSDPALVAAMSWFDKDSSSSAKNGSVPYDSIQRSYGYPQPLFSPDAFYHARGRRLAWQVEDYPFSLGANQELAYESWQPSDMCYDIVGSNYYDYDSPGSKELMNECRTCLTTKGWWRGPLITPSTQYPFADDDYPPEKKVHITGQPPPAPAAYRKWVLSGRVLNVRPPKFVAMRKALKDVIQAARGVRMGLATYNLRADGQSWFKTPKMLDGLRPRCSQAQPVFEEWGIYRDKLVWDINHILFNNVYHPAGESLFSLGGYYSSRADARWNNWFQQPLNPGSFGWPGCCNGGTESNPDFGFPETAWAAYTDWAGGGASYDAPTETWSSGQAWEPGGDDRSICFEDQVSAVILLTGNTPRYDNSVPITRMMELLKAQGARHPDGSLVQFDPTHPATNPSVGGINYCDQFEKDPVTHEKYTKADCDYTLYNWPTGLGVGNKNFMDDVSFFLSHSDLRGDLPGNQTVRTYVVGYGDSSPMLQSMALAGQGRFFRADSGKRVRLALEAALADIAQQPVPTYPPPEPLPRPPPNLLFLLSNNESMQDFSVPLPENFTPGYSPPPNSNPGDLGYVGMEGDFVNTGCSDPALVAAMSWFDKNSPDPSKSGSIVYDSDPDLGSPYFETNKFYNASGRRVAWEAKDYPYSVKASFQALESRSDALSACYGMVDWRYEYFYGEVMTECQACLETKGWWRGPRISTNTWTPYRGFDFPPPPGTPPPGPEAYRKWLVSGRVLNLRPPKFVVARKVTKDVIRTTNTTRMGVAAFGGDQGWFDPPTVLEPIRPTCDLSSPTVDVTALDRDKLARAVNRTRFGHDERAAGEALFGLGGYFSSQKLDGRWQNWFQQPLNPGYFGWPGCCDGGTFDNPDTGQSGASWAMASNEWLKTPFVDPTTGEWKPGQPWEGAGMDKSVCSADQESAVILLTDGSPRSDNSVPITKMMELLKAQGAQHPDGSLVQFNPSNPATNPDVGGINYCDQFEKDPWTGAKYTKADCDYTYYNWPTGLGVGNKNFMDDVAFFLSHADLRGDLPGNQMVRTFVVGYGDNGPMLQSMALAGQGQFYRVDNHVEMRNAFRDAIGQLTEPPSLLLRRTP